MKLHLDYEMRNNIWYVCFTCASIRDRARSRSKSWIICKYTFVRSPAPVVYQRNSTIVFVSVRDLHEFRVSRCEWISHKWFPFVVEASIIKSFINHFAFIFFLFVISIYYHFWRIECLRLETRALVLRWWYRRWKDAVSPIHGLRWGSKCEWWMQR